MCENFKNRVCSVSRRWQHVPLLLMAIIVYKKEQAVIVDKYGAHGCNVGEDGGFAPNISRQVFLSMICSLI
jgi:enolase